MEIKKKREERGKEERIFCFLQRRESKKRNGGGKEKSILVHQLGEDGEDRVKLYSISCWIKWHRLFCRHGTGCSIGLNGRADMDGGGEVHKGEWGGWRRPGPPALICCLTPEETL